MTGRVIPPLLERRSSDEYSPLAPGPTERQGAARANATAARHAARLGLDPRAYFADRRGTAATLRAIDAAAGGGFYSVPAAAETDTDEAEATFTGGGGAVLDVQTHLVRPSRAATAGADALFAFLRMVDPERWGIEVDTSRLSAAEWAACVFGGSETAVALLTSPPGRADENVLTNDDIAAAREIVDRYAGTRRVLTHTIVHPNLGAGELDRMVAWHDALGPAGWKVYTLWSPPERGGGGWFLDDEETGFPFLERVRELGPRVVCAHKGIAGPIASAAPATASPRDIGPAAVAFPDVTFVVYHSGYEPDPSEEGAHVDDPARGVSRLVTSLADAGLGPGSNVYAELGSTWFLMLRRPQEAAHVLGKLLVAVGEDRILWGTDSVWYGAPQRLIDAFRAFRIPEWMQERFGYPPLTDDAKDRILGRNAARLYGVEAAPVSDPGELAWLDEARRELATRLA